MSELIKKIREHNKKINSETLLDLYFESLENIYKYKKKKDFKNMFMSCNMGLTLIEPLIEWDKELNPNKFEIKKIPAIETCSVFFAAHRRVGQLENIKKVVNYFPELSPWNKHINKAEEILNIAQKSYDYIQKHKVVSKDEMKKNLGFTKGRLFSDTIRYMESLGDIKLTKNNNKIYITKNS